MKTLITSLALILLATVTGCAGHVLGMPFSTVRPGATGFGPPPVAGAPVMGAPAYGYGTPAYGAPGYGGYAPYGSVYAGTTFDPAMAGAIVADDRAREAARHPMATSGTAVAPSSPPSAPAADGSPYATRADLGVVIDQVLDDHAATRALRREVESRP